MSQKLKKSTLETVKGGGSARVHFKGICKLSHCRLVSEVAVSRTLQETFLGLCYFLLPHHALETTRKYADKKLMWGPRYSGSRAMNSALHIGKHHPLLLKGCLFYCWLWYCEDLNTPSMGLEESRFQGMMLRILMTTKNVMLCHKIICIPQS